MKFGFCPKLSKNSFLHMNFIVLKKKKVQDKIHV